MSRKPGASCGLWVIGFMAISCAVGSAQAEYSIAVKDFQEVFESLVTSTGVSPTDQDIATYYGQVKTRLPVNGSVDQISAPGVLAFTGLSALFCSKLVQGDAALPGGAASTRRAHKNVDFTQGPAGLTAAIQSEVIDAYAGLFWGRSPSNDEATELLSLISDSKALLGATPADTVSLLTVSCTAVASSLDSMVN